MRLSRRSCGTTCGRVGWTTPRWGATPRGAARSCPALATEAYAPEGLDAQLDAAVQRFVDDPRQFRLELAPRPTLWVNKVLDWYGGDFGGPAGVKRFFFRYLLAYSAAEVLR